jgi:hypothetical protein
MGWTWNTFKGELDRGSSAPTLVTDAVGDLSVLWIADPTAHPGSQALRSASAGEFVPHGVIWNPQVDQGPSWPTSLSPSVPAAAKSGPLYFDVLARGDHHLFHWRVEESRWIFHHPEQLPGEISDHDGSGPALVSVRDGRLDAFATTSDGDLLHWWLNIGWPWTGPQRLSADLRTTMAPAAVKKVDSTDGFDVLGLDTNGGVLHWWYPTGDGNFGVQDPIGSGAVSLAACADGPDQLHAFTVDSAGTVRHWWWGGSGDQPQILPGAAAPDGLGAQSAVSWGPNRIDLFARGQNSVLQHWWHNGPPPYGDWGHEELANGPAPRLIGSAPAAVSRGPSENSLDVTAWTSDHQTLLTANFGTLFELPPDLPCPPAVRILEAGDGFVHVGWTYSCAAPASSFGITSVGAPPFPMDEHLGSVAGSVSDFIHRFAPGSPYTRRYRIDATNDTGTTQGNTVTASWAPASPLPSRTAFTFVLSGDWYLYLEPRAVSVLVTPPGGSGRRYDLTRRPDPVWQGQAPASAGPAGLWTFQFHVEGTDALGQFVATDSPVWTYDWTVRGPAAYVTLDGMGTGDEVWNLTSIQNG